MISLLNLSKRYKVYHRPGDRLKEWLWPLGRPRHRAFWALRDLTLSVSKGTTLGIIGPNGAGKSTLLRILTGITKPTSGSYQIEGRVAALLELATGFNPQLTGRQNVAINGRLHGLTREEVAARLDAIIAFAELGEFIDLPLRTYSSGMCVRLGFALAVSVDPQVLLIDEVLAVGDAYFQQKCTARIREFKQRGVTTLIASHDPVAIKSLCDQAALLDQGRLVCLDKPDAVLEYYTALVARKSTGAKTYIIAGDATPTARPASRRSGTFDAVIAKVALLSGGREVGTVVAGQDVEVRANIVFLEPLTDPTVGVLIRDRLGNDVFGTNTHHLGIALGPFSPGEHLEVRFALPMNVGAGEYTLTVAVHTLDVHLYQCFDWADRVLAFTVIPSSDFTFIGVAKLAPVVQWRRVPTADAARSLEQVFPDVPAFMAMDAASDRFLARGWHAEETDDTGSFRWTERTFSFFLRPERAFLQLEVVGTPPTRDGLPLRGTVSTLGEVLGTFAVDRPGPCRVQIPLPVSILGTVVPFRVELSRSWRPCDEQPGSRDSRELGLAIRSICAK